MIIFKQKIKAIPFNLSGGEKSAGETMTIIKKLANHYKKDVLIRNLSVNLVSQLKSHDQLAEVKKIFCFVQNNIRYVKDIRGCETLQIPQVTLPLVYSPEMGLGAGDCDDHVILLASMLLSIGIGGLKMRVVKYKSDRPEWTHIYLVWNYRGKEYVMDAINKIQPFGWEVKYAVKKDVSL